MRITMYTGRAVDQYGNAVAGASVMVNLRSSGAPATIYSDYIGATAKTNPLTSLSDGTISFYAADDDYDLINADDGVTLWDVNLFTGAARSQFVIQTAVQDPLNNQIVLQDSNYLYFPIQANETWQIEVMLRVTTPAAAGFDFAFDIPAGATYSYKFSQLWDGAIVRGVWSSTMVTEDSYAGGVAALSSDPIHIDAILQNGATAGTVTFQFAQNVSNGGTTAIRQYSYIKARRIG